MLFVIVDVKVFDGDSFQQVVVGVTEIMLPGI